MEIDSEVFGLQSKIFGYWYQGDDLYYFGHIQDEQLSGIVEVSYKKGSEEKRQYSISKYAHGFELHISNFEYSLSVLNETEMVLIGPLPAGLHMKFKKLPNKISIALP